MIMTTTVPRKINTEGEFDVHRWMKHNAPKCKWRLVSGHPNRTSTAR